MSRGVMEELEEKCGFIDAGTVFWRAAIFVVLISTELNMEIFGLLVRVRRDLTSELGSSM